VLTQLRGVVTSFSNNWKQGPYCEYRKFKLSFPNEVVDPIWCTAWGKAHWGYILDPLTGSYKEEKLKRGLQVEAYGVFDLDQFLEKGSVAGFNLKSNNSGNGSFTVIGEYRVPIEATINVHSISSAKIKDKVSIYATSDGGTKGYSGTLYLPNYDRSFRPRIKLKANAIVTGFDEKGIPIDFAFDSKSNTEIEEYAPY
jgi:hypothetical protein